jgi:uncharacterized delta-60 repeat protein
MMPDGFPDTSFDGDGIAEYMEMEISNSMAVGPNGKIIVVGGTMGTDGSLDMKLFRVNEDGSIDDTFGDNGTLILPITPNTNEGVFDVYIQSDNKILVGGSNGDFLSAQHIIVRLNEDGSIDDSFADNGVFSPTSVSTSEYISQIEMNSNGDIYYFAQTTVGTDYSGIIGKLDENGDLDTSFGTDGFLNLFDEGYTIEPSSFYLFEDGDIEITGNINGPYYSGCKLRFEANADPDTSYGDNGAVTISGNADVYTYNSYVQADGKTVLLGLTDELVLIRLNQDGSIDTSFGTQGFWYPGFTTTYDSAVAAAILAGDEMIVLGSSYTFTANLFFASVFLNDNNNVAEREKANVKIFPNPTSAHFSMEIGAENYTEMYIYNQLGELIYQEKLVGQNGLIQRDIPAGLSEGVYEIVLISEDGRSSVASLVVN